MGEGKRVERVKRKKSFPPSPFRTKSTVHSVVQTKGYAGTTYLLKIEK